MELKDKILYLLENPKENWMDEDRYDGKGLNMGAYHEYGSKQHLLLDFSKLIYQEFDSETKIPYLSFYYEWNVCPECRQVRNRKLIGLDEIEDIAYVRYFIYHGEPVLGGFYDR